MIEQGLDQGEGGKGSGGGGVPEEEENEGEEAIMQRQVASLAAK